MKRTKKGFTLIELLIVIAIIAILIAIAIPTFAAQLNKANEAVDQANLRSATSLAVADYMLGNYSGQRFYTAAQATGAGATETMIIKDLGTGPFAKDGNSYPSKAHDAMYIQVTISGGAVTLAEWKQ